MALDLGEFALLANLDLSSVFDVVNVNLLLKRMRIVGLPMDVIGLVEVWLKGRMYFSRLKIGRNILCNRLTVLNHQVNLNWLNLSLTSFKLKVKSLFLTN